MAIRDMRYKDINEASYANNTNERWKIIFARSGEAQATGWGKIKELHPYWTTVIKYINEDLGLNLKAIGINTQFKDDDEWDEPQYDAGRWTINLENGDYISMSKNSAQPIVSFKYNGRVFSLGDVAYMHNPVHYSDLIVKRLTRSKAFQRAQGRI